jgi:hypothetical protein
MELWQSQVVDFHTLGYWNTIWWWIIAPWAQARIKLTSFLHLILCLYGNWSSLELTKTQKNTGERAGVFLQTSFYTVARSTCLISSFSFLAVIFITAPSLSSPEIINSANGSSIISWIFRRTKRAPCAGS